MFFLRLGVNQDIVKVNHAKVIQITGQSQVNISLERGRSVCQSKRQNLIFKMTITRAKSRLLLVSAPDTNPVVGVFKI